MPAALTAEPLWLQLPSRPQARVMAVQFRQGRSAGFAEFADRIAYFVGVAGDYGCDFICFPEFMALQLLSAEPRLQPRAAMTRMSALQPALDTLMRELAQSQRVNIIGGAYPRKCADGVVRNIASVYLRDGHTEQRAKLHVTPSESAIWGVQGGTLADTQVIDTDCGKIGIAICYDSEFPELVRRHAEQGALIEFVPYCTDERLGHLRVRYSCQARCVENQMYAVLAGNVGHLPGVANMDIQYAQSCILTPCDFPFARDGIAAEAAPDAEVVILADLDLAALLRARTTGTVRNLRDRRTDLYAVDWRES